jgi:hypothetical protein
MEHNEKYLKTRKRGISLIEAVLYLVIALAVIIGGIVFFKQMQISTKITDTGRGVVGISSQVRALYQSQPEYGTGQLDDALIRAGAVTDQFLRDESGTARIIHSFQGYMLVAGQGKNFTISFEDLPAEACIRLMTVDEVGNGLLGTGIIGVEMNGGSLSQVAPVSPADLTATCLAENLVVVHFARYSNGTFTPTLN